MAGRSTVSFDSSYLDGLDNTTTVNLTTTAKRRSLLMQCLPLLLQRRLWETMSDSDWDSLNELISDSIADIIT